MKDYARGQRRLALTLLTGLLLACPVPSAQAQAGQEPDNYAFRGSVTGSGEIRSQSGTVVGRVVMTNPGARFDVGTMSINPQGNVVDTSGNVVGRMMLDNGGSWSSAGQGAPAPAQSYSPAPTAPAPPAYVPAPSAYAAPPSQGPPQGYNYANGYSASPPTYSSSSPSSAPPNYSSQRYSSPSPTYNPPPQSATPRSVMTTGGQRIMFNTSGQIDMSKLTMDKAGNVYDVNGKVVGQIVNPNTGRPETLERGVPPPLVTSPPPKSSYSPPPRTRESSAVIEKSHRSSDKAAAKAAAKAAKAGLLASREADLAARRGKVESRIRNEYQEGRLSEEQMNELMSTLQSTVQTEQDFKRDKVLKDREMRFLYRKWDTMMGDLDDDLRKNARSAIGLRTR